MNRVCIFGAGYVGQELAALASRRGFDVSIVDTDQSVIESLETGNLLPNAEIKEVTTDGRNVAGQADVVIGAVPTPLNSSYEVDLSALKAITETVASSNSERTPLYIVESTVPPGTISDVVVPILQENGVKIGEDVHVGHAPERINPGNEGWELADIPRVVGAVSEEGQQRLMSFYDELLDASVHPVDSPAIAEASKLIENSYRDINIAFVNEVALALEKLNIDTKAVLDAADTKPFGFTRFSPGAGVGGHCIPIDPYFLIRAADSNGFNNRFLKYAREINDRMPTHVATKTVEELNTAEVLPNGAQVLILGKAFKSNVDDTRNSPYFDIKEQLERFNVFVDTYDPNLPDESTVDSPYVEADAVILTTAHDEFQSLSFERLTDNGVKVFVDGRNVYDPDNVECTGIRYTGIGR